MLLQYKHCSFCYNESAKTVRVVTRSERNCRAQDCPGVSEIIKKNKECSICVKEKRKKNQNGQSRETDNISTQDEEKQNKNTTQYVLDTIIRKET
jgi:hypothetical protein